MKKYLFIATFFIAIIGFAQTNMDVKSFSKIKINADAQVEVMYSTKDRVMFNVNEEELSNFTVNSEKNNLTIQQNGKPIPGLRIRIYTNKLRGLAVNGSSKVKLSKFYSIDNLSLLLKGNSMVDTGATKIKNLSISRNSTSQAIYANAVEVHEMVDGVVTLASN